jgi:hypothetical protein
MNMSKNSSMRVRVDEFLYNPFITEEGSTAVEGPYCLTCHSELEEDWRNLGGELEGAYEGFAMCGTCKQETKITSPFEELRKKVQWKLANEDWRVYKVGDLRILEPLNSSTYEKPKPEPN